MSNWFLSSDVLANLSLSAVIACCNGVIMNVGRLTVHIGVTTQSNSVCFQIATSLQHLSS